MSIDNGNNDGHYDAQTEIIKRALGTPGHSLDELLRLMRETGQAALYLAGSRLDHDYCFGSTDVGMLLSVLPEDSPKAAEPGYHPGSTEVYIPFQGSLVMESLKDGALIREKVTADDPLVLPPGQCHRLKDAAGTTASSVIIKTNLSYNPPVVRCEDCTYYPDKLQCQLYGSWQSDRGE